MGNKFDSRATLRRLRLVDSWTDLFGGTEFIAQRTPGHRKNTDCLVRCSSRGLAAGRTFSFDVKINK